MECSIIHPALSLSMKHLVIGQRQKAPNFSAFHWSRHDCLVSVGQYSETTGVVHLPKGPKQAQLPNRTEADLITRLCRPCIAAIAGYYALSSVTESQDFLQSAAKNNVNIIYVSPK